MTLNISIYAKRIASVALLTALTVIFYSCSDDDKLNDAPITPEPPANSDQIQPDIQQLMEQYWGDGYDSNTLSWGEVEVYDNVDGSQKKIVHVYKMTRSERYPLSNYFSSHASGYCQEYESIYGSSLQKERQKSFMVYIKECITETSDLQVRLVHIPTNTEITMYDFSQMEAKGIIACQGFKVNSQNNTVDIFSWDEELTDMGVQDFPAWEGQKDIKLQAGTNGQGTTMASIIGALPGKLRYHRIPVVYDNESEPDEIILLYYHSSNRNCHSYYHPDYYTLLEDAEFAYDINTNGLDWRSMLPEREDDPWRK